MAADSPWSSSGAVAACGVYSFTFSPRESCSEDELLHDCILHAHETASGQHRELIDARACRWQMHAPGSDGKPMPLMSITYDLVSTESQLIVGVWPRIRDRKGYGDAP
eukprot:CAMPEP_0174729760 /NCGR_PEP_ID=MMETSP1094-20130205/54315_1 /TAXON_ID=156173 /ORGANISM="Chrysochromulina brevifilum, Strain UTEX LB 985" /LENGTH=107 /DNA_ID=CAMNT_0015931919 /DNA_START=95 /DNA_END=418 /DNA_ORIENTATION=+